MNINATLIVEMLTFLVFVLFNVFVVWPPVSRALEKRRTQIMEGLASADQARQAVDLARREGEVLVNKARDQAASIVRQAEERALAMVDKASEESRKQAMQIMDQAHQELQVQVKAAQRELYNEIAGLALKAAGQVVHEELDDKKHQEMVGKLVKSWS